MVIELPLNTYMLLGQTTSTVVLEAVASPAAPVAASHPTDRCLSRFVSGEIGPRRKKMITRHIENCSACGQEAARLRQIRRTFRDLERTAIAYVASL